MTINYGARVKYPTGADVKRIADEIIEAAQRTGVPSIATQSGASVLASEIKRRLCAEINVEVDLVVTGKAYDGTPSAAAPRCSGGAAGRGLIDKALDFQLLSYCRAAPPHHFRGSLPGPL